MQEHAPDHLPPFPIWRAGREGSTRWLRAEWQAERVLYALGHSAIGRVVLYAAGAIVSLIGVATAAFGVWTYVAEAEDRALTRYAERASLINDAMERLIAAKGATLDQGQNQALEALVTLGIGLSQFDLSGTSFGQARLRHGLFFTTDLRNARFFDTDLVGANLGLAQLNNVEFFHADLRQASFENATAESTRFFESCAAFASFGGTRLAHARFYRTNITGTSFKDANLQGARFENVTTVPDPDGDLSAICDFALDERLRLSLEGPTADFTGANLRGASFFNADLINARGLGNSRLRESCSWGGTRLPAGIDPLAPCNPLPTAAPSAAAPVPEMPSVGDGAP